MSSVQKFGVPVLFFTINAVHVSLKSSREGDRFLFATYTQPLLDSTNVDSCDNLKK